MTTTAPRARRSTLADEALTTALVELAAEGRRPPCGDAMTSHLWLSDNPRDRALAAHMCGGCTIIRQCAASADANNERFGVWAGVDRTPTGTTKPKKEN